MVLLTRWSITVALLETDVAWQKFVLMSMAVVPVLGTDSQTSWERRNRFGWWVCCFAVGVHVIRHIPVCRWDAMISKFVG
jgi:hypothetical protein